MVKIIEVKFRRAEGPSEMCDGWHSFPTIAEANKHIREQSASFTELGYDKCDFAIIFEREDYRYEGRLDVKNPFTNPSYRMEDNDIYLHVKSYLTWMLANDYKNNPERLRETDEFLANLKENHQPSERVMEAFERRVRKDAVIEKQLKLLDRAPR